MKKIILFVSILSIVLVLIFCVKQDKKEQEFLRVHIRANSNEAVDQAVKYQVRDAVVDALIPVLSEVKTFEDAFKTTEENFDLIKSTADKVLEENGFSYESQVRLCQEHFPTRVYGDLTLEEGIYDALIIELGSGEGNNWWCLVYPAFCFTSSKNSTNFEYISKILEIIEMIT